MDIEEQKVAKILIVDDEEGLRQSLAEILELEGLQVTQALNGYDAVEKVKEKQYDVALIDIKMPGINGIETLNRVISLQPEIKAIMMTGHPVGDIQEKFLDLVFGFLHKPFCIDELISMIQSITYGGI